MNKPLPYDPAVLRKRAESIISNVRELAQLGWTPATSSNFSLRLDGAHAAITVSGRDKGRLVDSFYATSALMLALIATGFAISSALRPRGEEADHRAEPVLTTALPRRTWLLGHLAVTLAGAVAIVALAGLGMGLGYAMVTGDGGNVLRFAGATLAMLPGVLVLAGVAVLLHGLVPRVASLAWLALVWCAVVLLFGTSLRMPSWLQGVSPFHHLAAVPADPVAWTPWLVVLAVGAALGALGVTAFSRRDVR